MSKYHIKTSKVTVIDGIEYNADIEKDVCIDFSAAKYKVGSPDAKYGGSLRNDEIVIELIPDHMDFLHELTALFPLSDYTYKIVQTVYDWQNPYPFLDIQIHHKETGKKSFSQKVLFCRMAITNTYVIYLSGNFRSTIGRPPISISAVALKVL